MGSYINLRPYGGLANRMRTVAAGVQLSKDLNKSLNVIWVSEHNFNCPFNKIFKAQDYFVVRESPFLSSIIFPKYFQAYHNRLSKYIKAESIGELFYDKYFYGSEIISNELDPFLKKCNNIYIASCYEFRSMFSITKLFKPVQEVDDKIVSQIEKMGDNCIGVHIRRSDNHYSINESPLHLFIDQMKNIIYNDNNVSFFLSTDCKETELKLINEFGERILRHKKILDRSSIQGIKDAVIDLYSLSNTKMILGSSSSSFSKIASDISSIPLEILRMK